MIMMIIITIITILMIMMIMIIILIQRTINKRRPPARAKDQGAAEAVRGGQGPSAGLRRTGTGPKHNSFKSQTNDSNKPKFKEEQLYGRTT